MYRQIVSQMAFLIGVKQSQMSLFDDTILDEMRESNDYSLIRNLCQLRNVLLSNYYDIERELKNNQGRLSETERCKNLYNILLNKYGIDFELFSDNVTDYIIKVNQEIENHIDSVKPIFISENHSEIWEYIRILFIFPPSDLKAERKKFIDEREAYPFMCYINWTPKKMGNILDNDTKFLTLLYELNGKKYEVQKEEIVDDIYRFAQKCNRMIICIDCENVDYAAFYTALSQFKPELIDKIEKLVLFNDVQLKSYWDYYSNRLLIKTERVDCPRIVSNKSTLDIKMSTYIAAAHYRDNIDGFILVTSDSDYWGLIDTLHSTANLFFMGEKIKMSRKNIKALDNNRIPFCMLDDFYDPEIIDKIKEETYKKVIIGTLSGKPNFGIDFFIELLKVQTAYLSDEDKVRFRQVACNLKISFNKEGKPIYRIDQ